MKDAKDLAVELKATFRAPELVRQNSPDGLRGQHFRAGIFPPLAHAGGLY